VYSEQTDICRITGWERSPVSAGWAKDDPLPPAPSYISIGVSHKILEGFDA